MRAKKTDADGNLNHLVCQFCRTALARPNILMFEDPSWIVPQHNTYRNWWRKTRKRMQRDREAKVVVVEIGCGKRIPTVRDNSERIIRSLPLGQAKLIRINPDFELADSSHASLVYSMISIKEAALPALRKINEQLSNLDSSASEE